MMSDPQPQSTLLDYALDYLARGWPVFPVCRPIREGRCEQHGACKNAGKHPLVGWEAYQSRLPAHTEVTAWWRRWPTANIGMATGALSGVIVLDCDGAEARKAALDRGVPPTPTIFTGKPGGVHYHLAHPGFAVQNFARKLPGLDFRGDGGYVLLPPSHHARGADYRWVPDTEAVDRALPPDWLLDLIHGRTESASTPSDRPGLDLVALLDGVPEGERDDTLYRFACRLRGDNVPREYADFMVRQAARACRPAFDEDAAVDKVARAYAQYSPTLQLVVPAAPAADSPDGLPGYPIQTLAALTAHLEDAPTQLVRGVLWAERVHWAFAAPGAGKTLFLLAAGMHIAAGQPFCGRTVEQGSVLLIEEDTPFSVLGEYVDMLASLYGFDLATLPFYVNATQGLRLTDPNGGALVWDAIHACPTLPRFLLLDACESLIPSDKFNTRELDPLRKLLQQVVNAHITPAVIDHTRRPPNQTAKEKATAGPVDLLELLYGSRAKSAMSDVMMHFSGSPATGMRVTYCKFRGEVPDPLDVSFAPDSGFKFKAQKRQAKTPTEQAVLKWFGEHGSAWHDKAAVEAGVPLPERTLTRALGALVNRGWLEREGKTRDVRYRGSDIVADLTLEV